MIVQKDIDFIEQHRNSTDTKKITVKRLFKIYKTELGLKERRCFCSGTERQEFKLFFYEWYNNYINE